MHSPRSSFPSSGGDGGKVGAGSSPSSKAGGGASSARLYESSSSSLRLRNGRRRRRPTLWDVREPPYGIPMPPPGSSTGSNVVASDVRARDALRARNVSGSGSANVSGRTSSIPRKNAQTMFTTNASAQAHGRLSAAATAAANGYIPGPHDVVRAPNADEHGALAGIDVVALRALLSPGGVGMGVGVGVTGVPNAAVAVTGNAGTGHVAGGVSSTPSWMTGGNAQYAGIAKGTNLGASASGMAGLDTGGLHTTRHARRLYVGNLPVDTSEAQVSDFFNRALITAKGVESEGNPVISVYINLDKRFAFIETRTIGEAAAALALDGVLFRGMSLRMRRPNDYNAVGGTAGTPPAGFDPSILGIVSTQVSDGPNKVFVGGLPYHLTEDQIKELLQSYGRLAAFNLIKEPNTGMSKGFAFFEYADPSVMQAACEGLNGMQVGDKVLTVRRASATTAAGSGTGTAGGTTMSQNSMPLAGLVRQATRVLELRNIVTDEELRSEEDYLDIVDEMEEEGRKFGTLKQVVIPRPAEDGTDVKGVGRVFLMYAEINEAERAFASMSGRKFDQRTVIANYFSEERFLKKDF